MLRHIGYDIGIEGVARCLHSLSGQTALLGRYSRLVADLNRPIDSPECVIGSSDGTTIPGNLGLSEEARMERINGYYKPYHNALSEIVGRVRPKCILSIHSFTPMLRTEKQPRPWHCGILSEPSWTLAHRCMEQLRGIPGMIVGDNQPYKFDAGKFMAPRSVGGRPIDAVIVEIRQDLIGDDRGQAEWARILNGLIETFWQEADSQPVGQV